MTMRGSRKATGVIGFAMLVVCAHAQAASQLFNPPPSAGIPLPESPTTPPPPPPSADPCAAQIAERDGVVTLEVVDPTQAGQSSQATLDGYVYAAKFDDAGRMRLEAPLFHSIGDLQWTAADGSVCRRTGIQFNDFNSTYFLALVWDGPYDLALRIVEPPDGRVDGPTHYVAPERPNLDLSLGYGFLRSFGEPVAGTSRVWLYTVPKISTPLDGQIIGFVDFLSRGNPARSPFCGAGDESTANFSLLSHEGGPSTQIHRAGFAPSPCGFTWPSMKNSWFRERF